MLHSYNLLPHLQPLKQKSHIKESVYIFYDVCMAMAKEHCRHQNSAAINIFPCMENSFISCNYCFFLIPSAVGKCQRNILYINYFVVAIVGKFMNKHCKRCVHV